jgi:hypothetical protein
VRELERLVGQRSLEIQILYETFSKATDIAADPSAEGLPDVADVLGVSRSNLNERLKGRSRPLNTADTWL